MKDQIVMLLLGLLIALGGWTMTQTFSLSTTQAVIDDKVDKLERQVEKMQEHLDDIRDNEEEIMEQHENLFEQLRGNDNSGGYNYG
ncbi:MAG: hypothetical protein CMD98_04590 [Gammaproteobacteria bacterium]|nr:hypothetical protein [Gammaproteobacteria bacterium]